MSTYLSVQTKGQGPTDKIFTQWQHLCSNPSTQSCQIWHDGLL